MLICFVDFIKISTHIHYLIQNNMINKLLFLKFNLIVRNKMSFKRYCCPMWQPDPP